MAVLQEARKDDRQEQEEEESSHLVRLWSVPSLKFYLMHMAEQYQAELFKLRESSGTLLRQAVKQAKYKSFIDVLKADTEKDKQVEIPKAVKQFQWRKASGILVAVGENTEDAKSELTFLTLEDVRFKLEYVMAILKRFDEIEKLNISEQSSLLVYLRNGLPDRIVVERLAGMNPLNQGPVPVISAANANSPLVRSVSQGPDKPPSQLIDYLKNRSRIEQEKADEKKRQQENAQSGSAQSKG